MFGRSVRDNPHVATEERASEPLKDLAQVHAALVEAEARSEERRLALEGRDQEVGLMRIQLRVRDARIAALEKEVSDLGALVQRKRDGEAKSESAFLTQMRAALAESDERSEQRRLALESRTQELGLMRIQLRGRGARIATLDNEASSLGGAFAPHNERADDVNDAAVASLNKTIAALTATIAERDGRIVALNARQLADGETVAALQKDFGRAIAATEVQRKNLGALEGALIAANTRLAEEQASALAALELRNSMETEISEHQRRVARLEVELAAATTAVQAENLEQGAPLATASARVSELEADVLNQVQAITVQEEARLSFERAPAPEAELNIAEESIQRLEADPRTKSALLDDLAKASDTVSGKIAKREDFPEPVEPLFIRTDESEVVHVLGRKTTIGRTPENDVQINAQYISRHHAVILSGSTDTIIEDLNSTNGVTVNGRRVLRQTLTDGDIVLIANIPFRFAASRERAAMKASA